VLGGNVVEGQRRHSASASVSAPTTQQYGANV
jgi:hypothetical protein